jgi:oleate hydratase
VTADPRTANVWMVGGGIASMAAAAFLIRDAGVSGENIHILETLDVPGGSLDGAESPVQAGYEAYRCLWNLLEGIPDRDDPGKSSSTSTAGSRRRLMRGSSIRVMRSSTRRHTGSATAIGWIASLARMAVPQR